MKRKHDFDSEAELAAMLVEYLRETGCSAHQEVDHPCGVLDIAANKNGEISAFETKLAFTFAHLEQACRWRSHAHYSWVVLPYYYRNRYPDGWRFGMTLAHEQGVGVMVIDKRLPGRNAFVTKVKPKRNDVASGLINYLNVRQLDYSRAGEPGAKRWTRFKDTVEKIVEFVHRHPGCNINDVVSNVTHHYSSRSAARATIPKRCKKGLFPGVRVDYKAGIATFFPVTTVKP